MAISRNHSRAQILHQAPVVASARAAATSAPARVKGQHALAPLHQSVMFPKIKFALKCLFALVGIIHRLGRDRMDKIHALECGFIDR